MIIFNLRHIQSIVGLIGKDEKALEKFHGVQQLLPNTADLLEPGAE
jgi:hypothetical protein